MFKITNTSGRPLKIADEFFGVDETKTVDIAVTSSVTNMVSNRLIKLIQLPTASVATVPLVADVTPLKPAGAPVETVPTVEVQHKDVVKSVHAPAVNAVHAEPVEEVAPVVEETAPIEEPVAPVVEEPVKKAPAKKATAKKAVEATPAVEEVAPVVETAPVVAETAPTEEPIAPAVEPKA